MLSTENDICLVIAMFPVALAYWFWKPDVSPSHVTFYGFLSLSIPEGGGDTNTSDGLLQKEAVTESTGDQNTGTSPRQGCWGDPAPQDRLMLDLVSRFL